MLLNIFCGKFGGCQNEEKVIATSISIPVVLVFQNSFTRKCQYMAGAGAGAGAEIMAEVGAGAENK